MHQYDITILDYLLVALQRGRFRKAKRMIGVLVSRSKTPEDLVDMNRFIGYELRRYAGWMKFRWRNCSNDTLKV